MASPGDEPLSFSSRYIVKSQVKVRQSLLNVVYNIRFTLYLTYTAAVSNVLFISAVLTTVAVRAPRITEKSAGYPTLTVETTIRPTLFNKIVSEFVAVPVK